MAAAIDLRSDFDGNGLRRIARARKGGRQVRRLLALAAIYDGGARNEAARIGGVALQIVRDWMVRFDERGPDGLIDGKAPGALPLLSAEQRHALLRIVEVGPIPASHGAVVTDRPGVMGLGRVRGLDQQADAEPRASRVGTVRKSVRGRAVEHYAAMALVKRSPKMTANSALAMDHSRGGIFDSFFDRFKIR